MSHPAKAVSMVFALVGGGSVAQTEPWQLPPCGVPMGMGACATGIVTSLIDTGILMVSGFVMMYCGLPVMFVSEMMMILLVGSLSRRIIDVGQPIFST
jgi:hypothetical protein